MHATAKDVLTTDVVRVTEDMEVHAVAQLFGNEAITGAPVIGEGGRVIGVISQRDLLAHTLTFITRSIPSHDRERHHDPRGHNRRGGDPACRSRRAHGAARHSPGRGRGPRAAGAGDRDVDGYRMVGRRAGLRGAFRPAWGRGCWHGDGGATPLA